MIILDVRETQEFEGQRIPGSICCPMSQLDMLAPGVLKNIKDGEIIVMCRTGNRARIVLPDLQKIDQGQHNFTVYEGGIEAWKKQGKEVVGQKAIFPIMRQVQIVASTFIFIAFLLAHFVNPNWIYFALMVGFGLALAGYTGICPMAFLLQKMPWNQKRNGMKEGNCCGGQCK